MNRTEALEIVMNAAVRYAETIAADDEISDEEREERERIWRAIELLREVD